MKNQEKQSKQQGALISNLINADLVFPHAQAANNTEILTRMADRLFAQGYVAGNFLEFLLKREEEFPTGLLLDKHPVNIAIPHSNPEHVIHSAIAIATLKDPIQFHRMDNPEEEVRVSIIFMLAVNKPEQHIQLLGNLIKMIQNTSLIKGVLKSLDPNELVTLFKKEMNKGENEIE